MYIIHGPSQIMQLCARPRNRLRIWSNVILLFLGGLTLPLPITSRPCACIGRRLLLPPCANKNEVVPFDWYGCPAGLRER
jgi:hypothetical protein